MRKHISVAELVMVIGGAITFIFSFFSFWGVGGFRVSAWGNGTFPLASIPAILGGAMLIVGIVEQAGSKLPEPVLSFTWRQIRFTWGIVAAAIMLSYLIMDKGEASLKVGGIFMLLGALTMGTGSAMALLGRGSHQLAVPGADRTTKATAILPPPPPLPRLRRRPRSRSRADDPGRGFSRRRRSRPSARRPRWG